MANRSRGEYAVTLLDTDESAEPDTIEKMKSIDGVIRVIQITH
jgi:D-3-phosphoglycerate dehydrogenase